MNPTTVEMPKVPHDSPAKKSGFIIGPVCDSVLIIGAPILAVLIVIPLFGLPKSEVFAYPIYGVVRDLRQVFISSFIAAHLVLVYFRSHANINIFRTHPFSFTVVPAALLVATVLSPWVMGIAGVVAIWWDVYHSSMQTFGFGRIYDAKQGNNSVVGRNLDYWMNLVLYAGPVLAGAHFMDHVEQSRRQLLFLEANHSLIGDLLLEKTPDFLQRHQGLLTVAILSIGLPFAVYYLYSYYRLYKQGYFVSWQKVALFLITGTVSIYVWGFHSFLDAFFVMNFFHALQYFTIVWFAEQQNLTRVFRLDHFSFGKGLALLWIVLFCFLYGFWAGYHVTGVWGAGLAVTTVIMHFWYDGFIWSVRKRQI
jgi:hypothetical protein